jgi:hypothetical protein
MIPSIAEDITRVSFRFGLVVDQVCRSLEVSPDEINADGAWIYCAYGVDENEAHQAVARFNAEKVSHVVNVDCSYAKLCCRNIPRQVWRLSSTLMGSL